MHRRHRHDANHFHIARELEQCGFSVADTSQVGNDFPDLVIGRNGIDAKVEIKHTTNASPGQQRLSVEWRGSPIILAYRTIDVLTAFDALVARMRRY